MIRLLLFFIFISSFVVASVNDKIKNTRSSLVDTKTEISKMNSKLAKIVARISRETKFLENVNRQIEIVNKKIIDLKRKLSYQNKSLSDFKLKKRKLEEKKEQLTDEVIKFISNNYFLKQRSSVVSEKDLINEEILKIVAKESRKKIKRISRNYLTIDLKIAEVSQIIFQIENATKLLKERKKELAKLQQQKAQNLEKLKLVEQQYKNELKNMINNQTKLQQELAKLNVIQKKELLKKEQIAKANLQKIKDIKTLKKMDSVKVKNYGNIYMKTRTIRYRGAKTFAPIKGKIVKRFGAYKDPVYNIALYNDSITIKPMSSNSKVRAIFSGKVVFVGDTTNEGKMIVIKHNNHLHSIYAKLSLISPFIKRGYRVKKGEVIAKVKNELEFEITYKTLPINPLKVIRF